MTSKTQLVKNEQLTDEKAVQSVKDEQLTYEELTKLCRKKEEEIADLYKTIGAMSETNQCIAPYKPTYEELERDRDEFMERNEQNGQLVMALEKSLVSLNKMVNADFQEKNYWKEEYYKEHKRAEKLYDDLEELKKQEEKLNHKGYESNTITSNFKDFEINSSSSKTIISCEGCYCFEGTSGTNTNKYDTEQIIENCTVKIWSNSNTGSVKIGWWKNE